MRVRSIIFSLVVLLFILQSCSSTKQFKSLQSQAIDHFVDEEYAEALAFFDQSIALGHRHGKKIDANIFQYAGISAWNVENSQKTIEYLERVKEGSSADASTYYYLSKAYLQVDNLSREIINLEKCVEQGDSDYLQDATGQLFNAYVRSENWDKAKSQWERLNDEQTREPIFMEGYLYTLKFFENDLERLNLAKELLKINSQNTLALETLGLYYYDLAEKSYQAEMKAYEKNKTNKQYKQLLNALEGVNQNFRIARDYLETLYSIDPQPKYAKYIGNIYKRFKNDAKANYYLNKAKGS